MLFEKQCFSSTSLKCSLGTRVGRHFSIRAQHLPLRSQLTDAQNLWLGRACIPEKALIPRCFQRWIFELHAIRDVRELPTDVNVDLMPPPTMPTARDRDNYTTAEELVKELGNVGSEYETPARYHYKLDLSATDPLIASEQREEAVKSICSKNLPQNSGPAIESKAILVAYLRNIAPHVQHFLEGEIATPDLDDGLSRLFTEATHEWLLKRGWDVENIMTWAWILQAPNPDEAALRHYTVAHESILNDKGYLFPVWISLFVLRRQNLSALGLRYILQYATELMEVLSAGKSSGHPDEKVIASPHENLPGITEEVFIVMIIRLLRHSRETWPAACEAIMSLFCRYFNGRNFSEITIPDHTRLSFQYNTLLRLLAQPSSLQPYISTAYQQRAQFDVLHRMNEFQPPLVVDRRGYQAVAHVQLMIRKNAREREWAMLKAPSWPPWKRDRLGTDASIGPEQGVSRTKEMLSDAEEAGYAPADWESSASILAGWDDDGTPTIQSRRTLNFLNKATRYHASAAIWTSRIHATRTLNEAWAVFETYLTLEPSQGLKPSRPYRAVLSKIVHSAHKNNSKLLTLGHAECDPILPGDGPEVYPEPPLPRDTTFVRTKPPDYAGFQNLVVARSGITESLACGKLFTDLVNHAPSLYLLIKVILQTDAIPRKQKRALLQEGIGEKFESERRRTLKNHVSTPLANALVINLTKHRKDSLNSEQIQKLQSYYGAGLNIASVLTKSPLLWAWKMALKMNLKHRSVWIALLRARSQDCYTRKESTTSAHNNRGDCLTAWSDVLMICEQMYELKIFLDLEAIGIVMRALENALVTAERIMKLEKVEHLSRLRAAKKIEEEGLSTVKAMFIDAVRADALPEEIKGLSGEDDLEDDVELDEPDADESLVADNSESAENYINVQKDSQSSTSESSEESERVSAASENAPSEKKTFISASSLLPRLLEIPGPAFLHQFIRILGLYRDYSGLLDLIEWMALYSTELKAQYEAQRNGPRIFRSCIVATRVFLERSWVYYEIPDRNNHVLLERDVEPAPLAVWEMAKRIVEEDEEWGGWAEDKEVEAYVMKGRFM